MDSIRADFAAGCCSEADTAAMIASVRDESDYLIDTHTAVGLRVLRDFRAAGGQTVPAVSLSTASPFKFCGAVLKALGAAGEGDGAALVDELRECSGVTAPANLCGLNRREIRFPSWVEVADMPAAVDRFLSE